MKEEFKLKIGIISDIHGYPEKFKKAVEILKDADIILCAGDIMYHGPRNPILPGYNPPALADYIAKNKIPMLIARGNCDAEVDLMMIKLPVFSPVVVYENNGVRFMVLHGHNFDEDKLHEIADTYKINIMITGHTHIRKHEIYGKTLYVNPGSISVPKGDGQPSLVIYEDGILTYINVDTGQIIEKIHS